MFVWSVRSFDTNEGGSCTDGPAWTDRTTVICEVCVSVDSNEGRSCSDGPSYEGPILFCKLDIKDGFWRMCVPESDEEQFCYVLPNTPDDPSAETMLVVPAALQMGWTSSPAFFCSATETGRDVAEFLRNLDRLPTHPLEHHMLDPINPELLANFPFPKGNTPEEKAKIRAGIFHLFEVFVDDYVGLLQSTDPKALRHHSRALLHAIHQIFPPPEATGQDGENPVSLKKLIIEGEGIWDTRKEILGWIFDGLNRTMELPPRKIESRSETFLMYIHEQISAFAAGVSTKMSKHVPFRHIAGPTLHTQAAAA